MNPIDVIASTASVMRMPVPDILSNNREQHTTHVRHIAMYLCRELLDTSYPRIGRVLHRDHSTVMHGCKVIRTRMKTQEAFWFEMQRIRAAVEERLANQEAP